MQEQESLGGLGAHVVAVVVHDGGQPGGLLWPLDGIDLGLAPTGVHDDEPDQPGSHDEPDDEQPHVELGIHPPEV